MSKKHKKYYNGNKFGNNRNIKNYDDDSSSSIHQSDEIDNVENNEKIKVHEYNDLILEMKDAKEVLDALNSHRLSNEIDKLIMYLMDQNYKLNKKYTKISNDYSQLLADFRNYKKVSRSTAIYVNDLENSDYDKKSLIESVKAFAVTKEKEVGEKNRQIQSLYEVIDTINEHNPNINGTSIHEIVRTNEIKDKSIDYLTTMNNDLKDKNEILNDKYIKLLEKYNNTLTNYKYRNYQVNVMREWTSQIKEDLITGHLTSLSLLSQLNDHLTNIVDNYEIYSNNYEFELENDENIKIIKEDIKEISEFIFEYSKNRAKKDNIKPINPHKDNTNSLAEVNGQMHEDKNETSGNLTIEPIEEELNSDIEEDPVDIEEINDKEDGIKEDINKKSSTERRLDESIEELTNIHRVYKNIEDEIGNLLDNLVGDFDNYLRYRDEYRTYIDKYIILSIEFDSIKQLEYAIRTNTPDSHPLRRQCRVMGEKIAEINKLDHSIRNWGSCILEVIDEHTRWLLRDKLRDKSHEPEETDNNSEIEEIDSSSESKENSELDEFIENLLEFKDAEDEEDIEVAENDESGSDTLVLELETPLDDQLDDEEVLDDTNEDIKDDIDIEESELDKENTDEEAKYTEISKPEFEKLLNNLFDSEDNSEVEANNEHLDTENSVKEAIEIDGTENVIDDEIKTDINKEIRDLEEFVNDKTIDKDVLARMVEETLDSADNTSHESNSNPEKYNTKTGNNIIDLEVSNAPDEIEELDINELLLDESDVNVSKKTANKYIDSEKTLESKSIIGANAKKSAKTAINSLLVDETADDNDIELLDDDYDDIEDINDIDIIDEYVDDDISKTTVPEDNEKIEIKNREIKAKPEEEPINLEEIESKPLEIESEGLEEIELTSDEIELTSDEIEDINDIVEEEMKPKDYGIDITTIKIDDEKEDIEEEKEEIQSDEITEESVDNILENFSLDEVDITEIDI